jgi:toxin ParE1/3/4
MWRNFVSRILQRCRRIGNVPHGGQPRDDLMAGMRTVPFEDSAVITYFVTDKAEIVNIFHGGRDYDAFYQKVHSED